MPCVNCFFDSNNQKSLKKSTFGLDRFERKIGDYKKKYIDGLRTLVSVDKCACSYRFTNPLYVDWANEFLSHTNANTHAIGEVFDLLQDIYIQYISKSQKHAADRFWESIEKLNLVGRSENPMFYSRLLFRARLKVPNFDTTDPFNYFHIPFNLRKVIGNQRFSISGQPMLYFGNSIYSLTKELGKDISDLSIAAFLPNYSVFYHVKVNEIKNYFFDILVKVLPCIVDDGLKIDFYDTQVSPNFTTITRDLQRSILSEILTFPTEKKQSFVEEYVLPQLFTSLLIENGYRGVIFPSTKDYIDVVGQHRFSTFSDNLAMFVDYSVNNNYDIRLFKSFDIFLLDGSEKFAFSPSDILANFERVFEKNKAAGTANNNDFILPLVNEKFHIEYMKSSTVKGIPYFEIPEGRIELEFYMKLANEMYHRIR